MEPLYDYTHPRFGSPCQGVPSLDGAACGYRHDCVGHARDRDDDGQPVGPWRACRKLPRAGMKVCATHGGSTTHAIVSTREKLARAAELAAGVHIELLASDDEKVRQKSADSILDRTVGKKEREAQDVLAQVKANPAVLQEVLDAIERDPTILDGVPDE